MGEQRVVTDKVLPRVGGEYRVARQDTMIESVSGA